MKRKILTLGIVMAVIVGMVGCIKEVENKDEEKAIENDQALQKYIADSSFSVTKDSSGFYYSLSLNPAGVKLTTGDEVKVRFNAYQLDGTKIWTSEKDTAKLVKFPFFTGYPFVVPSMELALRKMRTGEKVKIFAPFYLGFYGNFERPLTGRFINSNIPAYTPIRIDLELVSKSSEIEQINQYIAQNNLVVSERTSDNLILIKTKSVATGDTLGTGKSVTVKYIGKLLDGTVFDPGTKPLSFVTGPRNGYITGFDRGVRKLKIGEKAIIILPSALGYGKDGVINQNREFGIRPYQPIQFEVEIL